MRRSFILLFSFVLLTTCNSNTKTDTKDDKKMQNDNKAAKDESDSLDEKGSDRGSQYNWTKTEQNKFMADCNKEFEGEVAKNKLKDFCSCVLTTAQRYYPSYRHMDEKSNEEHDKEILAECLGLYGDEQ